MHKPKKIASLTLNEYKEKLEIELEIFQDKIDLLKKGDLTINQLVSSFESFKTEVNKLSDKIKASPDVGEFSEEEIEELIDNLIENNHITKEKTLKLTYIHGWKVFEISSINDDEKVEQFLNNNHFISLKLHE